MDSEPCLRQVLAIANFNLRSIVAIIEFCCENLQELSSMSAKDLDVGVANLHKSMAGLTPTNRVRLNVSKCILLQSIRMHFYDRTRCNAPLEEASIMALGVGAITTMKSDYAESLQSVTNATILGDIKVPKLTHLK